MKVYWYKYRDDLWKKVTLYRDPLVPFHDTITEKHSAEKVLSVLDKEDECYAGFERLVSNTRDGKARCNVRRAARHIQAYALCNDWDWFFTGTIDAKKKDRSDIDAYKSAITKFMVNQRRSYPNLEYLIVPELHSDGVNWHMHALVSGLPVDALRAFKLSDKPPKYIRDKLKQGHSIYEWEAYRRSFGFNDIEPILSRDAAARYISKYLTKNVMDVTANSIGKGKRLYIPSSKLKLPTLEMELEIEESTSGGQPEALSSNCVPDAKGFYSWEYGEVQWFQNPC